MTEDGTPVEPNLRSDGYLVARTHATCPRCGSRTAVMALALERGHETYETDDEPPAGGWQSAATGAWLFHVEYLSPAVQGRLREIAPHYRPAADDGTGGGCWVNHCEYCGAALADDDLHCEPGAAFMPQEPAGVAAIELIACRGPFEAAAGGYSLELDFPAFIRGV